MLSCGHVSHRICIEKRQDSPSSQSSETSALSDMMRERFILTSPTIQMGGNEDTVIQRAKSSSRRVKCSEDLSSCLLPIGFLQFSLQAPSKPLIYLTCKHIVHYYCIDNPRKLCPICPSTDMEIDNLENSGLNDA